MSLAGIQTALGRSVKGEPCVDSPVDTAQALSAFDLTQNERAWLARTLPSPGFRFTVAVQRSWCEGRAATTARQTLSVLPADQRQRLLADWVARGAGTSSFVASEAEDFLEFIANRLPAPSHVHTLCRLEQAAYRASSQSETFVARPPSALRRPNAVLRTGRWAALVPFYVPPDVLMAALQRAESLPVTVRPCAHLLFAPGLPGLFRPASSVEVRLWTALRQPVAVRALTKTKLPRRLLHSLLAVGAIDVDSARGV